MEIGEAKHQSKNMEGIIVMDNNENLVLNGTENVEQTTEQTPKTYTDDEVNEIVGKKLARREAKLRKEYDRKYGELEDVLKAGMGKDDIGEITSDLRTFYTEKKNIKIPNRSEYSAKDIETLARVEADEIIKGGFEEVIEEADRLKELGANNMTEKEKVIFKKLTDHIFAAERNNELEKIGVTKDVYGSEEFTEFASQFNSKTPIAKVYEIYAQTQPKKNIKTMGSMKTNTSAEGTVKDFYTVDEARKFTKKDYDNNPELFKAVERSMTKWK